MRTERVGCLWPSLHRCYIYSAVFVPNIAQAQSKIKILEKLPELVTPPKDEMEGLGEGDASVYFKFPEPEKLSPPILQMNEVTFAYPNTTRIILNNISFDLRMDSKVAIVGPNGAGTTLSCSSHSY
jgi:ATP-binding cassette subfamily F protein 3